MKSGRKFWIEQTTKAKERRVGEADWNLREHLKGKRIRRMGKGTTTLVGKEKAAVSGG